MEFKIAERLNAEKIFELIQSTINSVYPKYYPQSIVDFFCELHSKEKILADIEKGSVKILLDNNRVVGTVSFSENHISRLFIESDSQNMGYGSYAMQCIENEVSLNYNMAYLEASLPAVSFYERNGYRTVRHERIINGNSVLVYDIMEKILKK